MLMRGCMKVPMRGRAGVVSLTLLYLLYLLAYPMHLRMHDQRMLTLRMHMDLHMHMHWRMHTLLCMHMPLRMCTRCMQYAYACAYAPMRARIFALVGLRAYA